MARPRAFDEASVISAIQDVFWDKGFEGASYKDLVAASGLHKGSLYAAFGDKRALYLRALDAYGQAVVAPALEQLTAASDEASADDGGAPMARIYALLDSPIRALTVDGDRRGCLLCNAAVDQAPHDEAVAAVVAEGFQQISDAIEHALEAARAQKPRSDRRPSNYNEDRRNQAAALTAAYFGLRAIAKAGASQTLMEAARDGALASLRL